MLTSSLAVSRTLDAEPWIGGLGVLVDYFAGGGGASTGMEMAYGRKMDLAVNHNRKAVAMHERNHPETEHACCDVYEFDIVKWLGRRRWTAWWTSPDCTHHSRAKGSKPVSSKRRALADVVVQVVEKLPAWQRPEIIHLENVPEFVEWGPLDAMGRPIKERKGEFFNAWRERLIAAGYVVEHRVLACDLYGIPTTRKRLVLVARRDGYPIVWPEPTHYNPKAKRKPGESRAGKQPRLTAGGNVIDFSIPGKSIFGRKKELAAATQQRIARGIDKFVLKNGDPFIVPLTHHGERKLHPMDEPPPTITAAHRGELALVQVGLTQGDETVHGEPFLAAVHCNVTRNSRQPYYAADRPTTTVVADGAHHNVVESLLAPFVSGVTQSSTPRVFDAADPAPTVTTAKGGELTMVAPVLVPFVAGCGGRAGQSPHKSAGDPLNTATAKADQIIVTPVLVQTGYGEREGQAPRVLDIEGPVGTVVADGNKFAVATAHMLRLQGSARNDGGADEPLGAVLAGGQHHAQVAAFLAQYNNDKRGPHAGHGPEEPVSTIATTGSHQAVIEAYLTPDEIEAGCERVLAFMLKYYGTHERGVSLDAPLDSVTTKDRFALITVHIKGVPYRIYDIRMRMLTRRELFRAQGFPDSYVVDPWVQSVPKPTKAVTASRRVRVVSKRMTVGDSISMCGNSVPPRLAYVIAKANRPPMSYLEGRDRWAA